MPFEKSGKDSTKNAECRYSTAECADTDEFMLWSVHDHPYGRNRARARAHGAVRSVAADSMSTAMAPVASSSGPFGTAYDVVGAGERAGVDGAAGHGPRQCLDQQLGADAAGGAARVPGLLGDHQVTGVHAGGESRRRSRWPATAASRSAGSREGPGDGAFGGVGPHARYAAR